LSVLEATPYSRNKKLFLGEGHSKAEFFDNPEARSLRAKEFLSKLLAH
jgi:hypothetical protein